MTYISSPTRYDTMAYRRCGKSGLLLPALSLGLWHNFGSITPFETQQSILRTAFDNGITHFRSGQQLRTRPYGEAERNFGRTHAATTGSHHRDELVISTKGGLRQCGQAPTADWRQPEIPDGQPRSEPQADESGLCGYLLPPPNPDPETPIEETMRRAGSRLCAAARRSTSAFRATTPRA